MGLNHKLAAWYSAWFERERKRVRKKEREREKEIISSVEEENTRKGRCNLSPFLP